MPTFLRSVPEVPSQKLARGATDRIRAPIRAPDGLLRPIGGSVAARGTTDAPMYHGSMARQIPTLDLALNRILRGVLRTFSSSLFHPVLRNLFPDQRERSLPPPVASAIGMQDPVPR